MQLTQPKATLFTAHAELQQALEFLEEAPEEQRQELVKELQPVLARAFQKVDRYVEFLHFLEAQAKLHAEEIKRLQERKKRIEGWQERLIGYARETMQNLGLKRLEGDTSALKLRESPGSVEVHNAELLPAEYQMLEVRIPRRLLSAGVEQALIEAATKVEIAPIKADIAKALKAGKEVPGADLVRVPSVVIE